MPKADRWSPKGISNAIKSKGLQKLRWYCQMCQKQCRDENGFKCHMTSESHQRQLLLFAETPHRFLDDYSREFEKCFMDHLKRRFNTKRVHANQVYQEIVANREHMHMNGTKWTSLTGFINYLGRCGKCVVDHTEKGWFITYIDRDPETLERNQAALKKQKMDRDDEERMLDFVQKQAERAKAEAGGAEEPPPEPMEFKRDNEDDKIQIAMKPAKLEKPAAEPLAKTNPFEKIKSGESSKLKSSDKPTSSRLAALEEIKEFEERRKEKQNRKDYWLHPNIVVKVVTEKAGKQYYKQKGVVKELIDDYTAVVKMLDSGDKLKLDQAHLETVIPNIGKPVMVVNGAYRGLRAILENLDVKNFCVSIRIDEGPTKDRLLEKVKYEDVCKLMID